MASDTAPNVQAIFGDDEPDRKKDGSFHGPALGPRIFSRNGDGRYMMAVTQFGITFEIDRLRRERHELWGELGIKCSLAGARTYEGVLTLADFNLSSAQSRTSRAKLAAGRAKATDLDWEGLIEEFCQRVITSERQGAPAIHLRDLPEPDMSRLAFTVYGLSIPQRHPAILFGDGGSAKSFLALGIAGHLASETKVAYFDWELEADDHRHRLGRLFPAGMPDVLYVKCDKPLVHDIDRMKRIVEDEGIDYAIFDSIVFACAGPAENSDIAAAYLQAVRRLNIGSLHVAHVTKSEGGDQKPFGSIFWHNGARATWNIKREEQPAIDGATQLAIFPKKYNLSGPPKPLGLSVYFDGSEVRIVTANVADMPVASQKLSIHARIKALLLTRGQLTADEIAADLTAAYPEKPVTKDVAAATIRKAIGREFGRAEIGRDTVFRVLAGGRES